MAEDPAVGDGRDIAPEDVQVGAADRGGVDVDDGVGRVLIVGSGTSSQAFWPGPW